MLVTVLVMFFSPSSVVAEFGSSSGWGTATLIETESGSADAPRVAVDPSGNAIAVWKQYDGSRWNIWANRYVAGSGWGVASLIEVNMVGSAREPVVAVDRTGNATAVWSEWDGTRSKVYSNRYIVGTGWGRSVHIGVDGAENATRPDVAMDESGNAIAVWAQSDGTRYNIYANRYAVGVGWWTPTLIETDNSGNADYPVVAVDSSGNAIAAWQQHDGARYNIWANRYMVGMGWGIAEPIETENVNDAHYPDIAVDDSGNFIVVWSQHDGTRWNIWSNRYVRGAGWEGATRVETDDTHHAVSPSVAVDSAGNAIAVWVQSNGGSDIWANRYTVGVGWGTAELIETDSGSAGWPAVAADDSGNAIAVWSQYDGISTNIVSNRYAVGVGWGTAGVIETENAGSIGAHDVDIGVDSSGNAIAVWWQDDGIRSNIWANRYVPPDTTPPHLSIYSPSEGYATDIPMVIVSGSTEPDAILSVNGMGVSVSSNGSFSCAVVLVNGTNIITAIARDASGNSVTVTRTVTYNDPIPDLEERLSGAQQHLAALEDELDDAREDLADVTEEAEGLNAEVSDLRAMNLILMALFAAFALLAVAMSVMYFRLRRAAAGKGEKATNSEPPPPPG